MQRCDDCPTYLKCHREGCDRQSNYRALGVHFETKDPTPTVDHVSDAWQPRADEFDDATMAEEMRRGLGLKPVGRQMVLTSDSAARKAMPLFSGLVRYFPRALAMVAQLSLAANEKHNPGQPLHWSEEKSKDHRDAALRHLFDSEAIDPEFGFLHDVGLAWRALANLETILKNQENK